MIIKKKTKNNPLTWSKCNERAVRVQPGRHRATQLIHTGRGHHVAVAVKQAPHDDGELATVKENNTCTHPLNSLSTTASYTVIALLAHIPSTNC